MAQHLMVLAVFIPMILGVIGADSSSFYSTEAIAARNGYIIETHNVITNDGYILTLHHLIKPNAIPRPYSPIATNVMFFMHGLLCSSSDWLIRGNESLAMRSIESGYDVWLGNARGNKYSRSHTTLDPNSSKFWDFDWHEIGVIDLPAMISYVLEKTGANKLIYVGHSQGTTSFFVLNSLFTDYNKYFETAHLLSPPTYMSHLTAPFVKTAAPLVAHPTVGLPMDILGNYEFSPSQTFMNLVAKMMCNKNRKNYVLCSNALFLAAGFDENTVADGLVDAVMASTPAGASTKQFLHYMQCYNSGKFRQFDYGMARNLIKYRQTKPPNYPLGNIDVPIYLYYSDSDAVVAVKDVELLMADLPSTSLKMAYRIPDPTFDHLGQLYNAKAKYLVYDVLFNNVQSSQAELIQKANIF